MAKNETKVPVKGGKGAGAVAPAGVTASFDSLRQEIDRLFDDFQRGYWRFPFGRKTFDIEPLWRGEMSFGPSPAVDIVEKDGGYEVTAELPGLDERDIEVRFSDGTLTIKGEKHETKEEKKKDYYLSERRYGAFQRSFRVPAAVDADKIAAAFKGGVLTVSLPKSSEALKKEKSIPIKKA